MREGFEARILELTQLSKESQDKASYERNLREEIERTSQSPHASLKKTSEESRDLKYHNQRLKVSSETLRNESR